MSSTAQDKKTFTWDEANALMPEVRRLTEDAVRQVDELRDSDLDGPEVQRRADEVMRAWVQAMNERGIEVKGLWLIDFDNGSGYYCWQHPEPALQFYHSYDEGFRGRLRIQ